MKHCSHCGRELKPEQEYGFPKVYCQRCWLNGYGQPEQVKQPYLVTDPLPMDELWNDEKKES
jgi:hypothetical protein